MSNQPPSGQGSWQQPPAGPPPPPGQGPGGPPGPPPPGPPPGGPPSGPPSGPPPPGGPGGPPGGPPPGGPPPPGGYGPGGPGGPGGPPPPGGPGGPGGPPFGPGGPPGKSKLPIILGSVGAAVLLVGGGLLLYFLVFSGDDEASTEEYCNLLEDNTDLFANLSTGVVSDPQQVEDFVNTLHELREAAPEEVEDEWAQIDDPFQDVAQALDDAGISWEDASNMAPEDFPDEVSQAAEDLGTALSEMDLSAIGQTIEDHAEDECGIDPSEFQPDGQ
jgi:hypothetical protein